MHSQLVTQLLMSYWTNKSHTSAATWVRPPCVTIVLAKVPMGRCWDENIESLLPAAPCTGAMDTGRRHNVYAA